MSSLLLDALDLALISEIRLRSLEVNLNEKHYTKPLP